MPGLRDRTSLDPVRLRSPLASVSMGVGTAAVLATTTVHMVQRSPISSTHSSDLPSAQILLPKGLSAETSAVSAQQIAPEPTAIAPLLPLLSQQSAFERARTFGWQAALKGQNLPDIAKPSTAKQWGEAALLWQQAIYFLGQVPVSDSNYAAAQGKRVTYEQNLQQIMVHQLAALSAEAEQVVARSPLLVEEEWIAIAKQQGWQAALTGQNAPHPANKWAEISRLWQNALKSLEKIETSSSQYAEAKVVKAQYQENLLAIRKRYQIEQATAQQLQSLRNTLREIKQSTSPLAVANKSAQLTAIIDRLRTIPQGTTAYAQAQTLIATTTVELNNLPVESSPRLATIQEPAGETEAQ